MSHNNPDLNRHPDDEIDLLVKTIGQFEEAWDRGERPAIDDYLPAAGVDRRAVLVELIHLDLQRRLQVGEPVRIEGYLEKYRELADDRAAVLDLISRECQVRRQREPGVELQEYLQRFPEYANELATQPPDSPDSAGTPPLGSGPARGPVLSQMIEGRGRYTVTKLQGEGGLGKVWLARDRDLNRMVALKELQPAQAAHAKARRRFVLEAQVTGQLEHPNIVPVYELARRDQEHPPFYIMRFVRGQTLRDRIAEYHQHRREGKLDPLELPKLLNAFVDVCNAVAYAHSKGVVHRDLKPVNVMVGRFGEVIVLDWGLAKMVERADPQVSKVGFTDDARTEATLAGCLLGTPAYMAPEQAEGRIDQIDARTDVYCLGAMLFEVLCGTPPHQGKNTAELISGIVAGPTPRSRVVESTAPAALDAVCAKAMAKEQSERYASASDLAADVQCWLADEPVSVYPDPWQQRVLRWVRRHWVPTLSAAVALVGIALVAMIATLVVNHARVREAKAKDQSQQLMTGFRGLTDELLTQVGQGLKTVPGGQKLRGPLLERAAQTYEQFYHSNPDNPDVEREWGWALVRLGRVREEIGDYATAEQNLRSAQAIFRKLADAASRDPEPRYALATSQVDLALILFDQGQYEEAENTLRTAGATFDDLQKSSPDTTRYGDAHAGALVHLGNALKARLKYAEAEELLVQAIEKYKMIVDAVPDEPRHRVGLVTGFKSLGELLMETGNARALAALRAAIEESQRLVNVLPDVPEYRERLAASRLDYGQHRYTLGNWNDAGRFYQSAVEQFQELAAADSAVPRYHEGLALALNNRGVALRALGDYSTAEVTIRNALDEYVSLVRFHPEVLGHHVQLAGCRTSQGQLLRDMGRNAEAEDAFRAAIAVYQSLPAEFQGNPLVQNGWAVARSNLGWTLFKLHQVGAAETTFRVAIAGSKDLVQKNPHIPGFAESLAWTYTRLGDVLVAAGNLTDAAKEYREALTLRERLALSLPHIPDHQYKIAWLLATCGDVKLRDPARAVSFAHKAVELAAENDTYLTTLGVAQYRAEEWAASLETLTQSSSLRPAGDPVAGFFLAMGYEQLGQKDEAAKRYHQAIDWMVRSRPDDPEVIAIRSEAANRLGLPLPPEPK